jgi:putative phosphoribosyl transferase
MTQQQDTHAISWGFRDRTQGGKLLAERLREYSGRPELLVLGLPRGGIPVAYEVAEALDVPLELFLVRKLGLPGNPELAMGAVASGGLRVLNHHVTLSAGVTEAQIQEETMRQLREIEARERMYREGKAPLRIENRTVILVDDGLATGATMRAGICALRQGRPAAIIAAAPVASPSAFLSVQQEADETVCLLIPEEFASVGQWYSDFRQVSDDGVRTLLANKVHA